MLYIKCLAQGPRVVVVVMLLAAASTTVLTSSQSAPPSPLVPGPLQASTCFPNRLQALGSTPVDGSPGALPITASSRSLLLQVSAHRGSFQYTHVTQLYSREVGPERPKLSPRDAQQFEFLHGCGTEFSHCLF